MNKFFKNIHVSAKKLNDALDEISNNINVLSKKQEILSEAKFAAHIEKAYISNLAKLTDLDLEAEAAKIKYGKYYDEAAKEVNSWLHGNSLSGTEDFGLDDFFWKEITEPELSLGFSQELKSMVDEGYADILENRKIFIKSVKKRCEIDGGFRKIFLQKLSTSKYPYMEEFL